MEVGFVCLHCSADANTLAALKECCSRVSKRLYVHVEGAPSIFSPSVLHCLEDWYSVVGDVNERLDVVPLFQLAGWDPSSIKNLDVTVQFIHDDPKSNDGAAVGGKTAPCSDHCFLEVPTILLETTKGPAQPVIDNKQLEFQRVAVGGTFDRLHAGHRLLLCATALASNQLIYVGITGDKLLHAKNHQQLLESFTARSTAATEFLLSVRPSLDLEVGALVDPKEQTAAETRQEMQALVASEETAAACDAINAGRISKGFSALEIVTVGLVKSRGSLQKISSSMLREADKTKEHPPAPQHPPE